MPKPKVFITRVIPDAGLGKAKAFCDAEIWTEPLPPPYDVLKEKVTDCEGLLSLLTERIDAELLDAAPKLKVVSNYAVGFNNIDTAAATERGVAVGRSMTQRRTRRFSPKPGHMKFPSSSLRNQLT